MHSTSLYLYGFCVCAFSAEIRECGQKRNKKMNNSMNKNPLIWMMIVTIAGGANNEQKKDTELTYFSYLYALQSC